MDYELNRKILFSEEIEYKSLYSWCLQELDANGDKIGLDQIPWAWTNRFIATSLRYGIQLNGQLENLSRTSPLTETKGKTKAKNQLKISETESINASISSEDNETIFSMFGTERTIKDINLSIYKDIDERCSVWGCPSYVTEIDFRDIEQPDTIQFNLFINPDKFNKIVELIKSNNVNKMLFTARGVMGFYSEWSPSISTNKIKVLCNYDDHKVEVSEKSEITIAQKNIPRLGEVSEFNLTFIQNQNKELTLTKDCDDEYSESYGDEYSENFDDVSNSGQNNLDKNLMQIHKLIHPLKQSLIVIVILLLLILIFK